MTIKTLVKAMKEAFEEVLNSLVEFGFEQEELSIELLEMSGNFAARFSERILIELRDTFAKCHDTEKEYEKNSFANKDSKVIFDMENSIVIIEGCPSYATSLLLFLMSQTKSEMEKGLRTIPKQKQIDLVWIVSKKETDCKHCGRFIAAKEKVVLQRKVGGAEIFCSINCAENQSEFELESRGIYRRIAAFKKR